MYRLTNKQKLALIFGLYVSIFIIILTSLFYFIFKLGLMQQYRNSVNHESTEIINNHIILKDNKLDFIQDKGKNSLSGELTENNFSALIFDNDMNLLKSYGLFDIYTANDKQDIINILQLSTKVLKNRESYKSIVQWRGQKIYAFFAPLKIKENIYGVLIVGKSLEQLNLINNLMLIVFGGIGLIAFGGSFFLGLLYVHGFLKPVRKLTKIIEKVDLEELDNSIDLKGNEKDELVVLVKKFNEMMTRLKHMSGQQKDFIANASHELKTPLTKAISSLDVLLTSKKFDKEELELVKKDLFDMNNLINKLLFLSRLKKTLIKNGHKIKLKPIIDSSIVYFAKDCQKKEIVVHNNIHEDICVYLSEEYAEVLFSNIISNAIKYSLNKTAISINSYIKNNKLEVEVVDQGIGINQNELKSIFNRFYRSRGSRRMEEGHGIGLSLVKQICDVFEIEVKIESEKNKGTKFVFIFN